MKKSLTLAAIAIIFASNFANASNGGKVANHTVKTTKTVKYVKISAKEFSVKNMQDTKDMLIDLPTVASNDYTTTTTAFAGR